MGAVTLVFMVLFLVTVFGHNGYMDFKHLQLEKQMQVKKNNQIETENLQLYRTVKRLKHDPKFIENEARQELGMIGKDEVILKFKKEKKKSQ